LIDRPLVGVELSIGEKIATGPFGSGVPVRARKELTLICGRVKAGKWHGYERRRTAGSKVLADVRGGQLPTAGFNSSCPSSVEAD